MKSVLILIGVGLLSLPGTALARHGVSGDRKVPIVRVGLGRNVPVQCAAVYISTSDRFWASVTFAPQPGYGSTCQMYGSNGVTILHHVRGRWRFVTAGSFFMCPVPGVPRSIANDLVRYLHC